MHHPCVETDVNFTSSWEGPTAKFKEECMLHACCIAWSVNVGVINVRCDWPTASAQGIFIEPVWAVFKSMGCDVRPQFKIPPDSCGASSEGKDSLPPSQMARSRSQESVTCWKKGTFSLFSSFWSTLIHGSNEQRDVKRKKNTKNEEGITLERTLWIRAGMSISVVGIVMCIPDHGEATEGSEWVSEQIEFSRVSRVN